MSPANANTSPKSQNGMLSPRGGEYGNTSASPRKQNGMVSPRGGSGGQQLGQSGGGAEYTVRPKVKPTPRQEVSPLMGVWHYSSGDRYRVSKNQSGQLCFEELHGSGRKMHAMLEPSGEWLQGDLLINQSEENETEQASSPKAKGVISNVLGEQLGTVRLRYDSTMGMAVLNFKAYGKAEWDTEIVARKASAKAKAAASTPASAGGAGSQAAATGANQKYDSRTAELHRWLHRSHQEAHELYSSGHLTHGTPSAIARAPMEVKQDTPIASPARSPANTQERCVQEDKEMFEPSPQPPSRAMRMENLQRRLSVLCKPGQGPASNASWNRTPQPASAAKK